VVDLAKIKNPQVIEGIVCKHPLSIRLHGFPSWKNAGGFLQARSIMLQGKRICFFGYNEKVLKTGNLSEQG